MSRLPPTTPPATPRGLHLAELLATRLCHDIAGPAGTIAGLIELAVESGDGTAALAEAGAAAARLAARLRLLRAAWASDPAGLSTAGLAEMAKAMTADRSVSIDLAALLRQPDFSPAAGRIVINLLMLGIEALNGAGTVHLAGSAGREVMLRIDGPRAAWPAGMSACLLDPGTAWTHVSDPRRLQMPLTILLAAEAGHRLSLLMPTGAVTGAPPPLLLHLA